MKRALATELCLVNWKGVFFERYLLDSNVTALEGDNGAGKTTVMIAAYVALFPDLSRLRFTNLGETGATGGDKGIWGRLGEPARPSYTALTVVLGDGTEVILGVVVVRKAEPALTLQPFLISGLPREPRVRDFLLRVTDEHDEIPTMDQVKKAVAGAGAEITVFQTSKAYFAALFELGVSPMRLGTDEERNKYNDMLRTSMTGGISRALTSELRSFVFKQETGLADTLSRMRGSLGACRKTRTEVSESRKLERHISGVFDAGFAMFEAAAQAARAAARQTAQRVTEARQHLDDAEAAWVELGAELSDVTARQGTLETRLSSARSEHEAARAALSDYQRALTAASKLAELQEQQQKTQKALSEQEEEQAQASARRTAAARRRTELQSAVSNSAQGLANLQTGLEQLHRRAHAHHRLRTQVQTARDALLRAGFCVDDLEQFALSELQAASVAPTSQNRLTQDALAQRLAELQREARQELQQLDQERARRVRHADTAQALRDEYECAVAALRELCQTEPEPPLLETARRRLAALAAAQTRSLEVPELQRQVAQLQQRKARRQALLEQLAELELSADLDGQGLAELLGQLDLKLRNQREEARQRGREARQLDEERDRLEQDLRSQEAESTRFAALTECAERLSALDIFVGHELPLEDEQGQNLEGRVAALAERMVQLAAERDAKKRHAAELRAFEGQPDPELTKLRDIVSGEFLARRFEELEPDTARYTEARLGPLRSAIVVEDLEDAQKRVAEEETPVDVWLVDASADLSELSTPVLDPSKHVVVATSSGVRISRVPEIATLGREARKRLAATLEKTAAARDKTLEEEAQQHRQLQSGLRDWQRLREERTLWLRGDPAPRIEALQKQRAALDERARAARQEASVASVAAEDAFSRSQSLAPLLAQASLLDERELPVALARAEQRLEEAQRAAQEVARCGQAGETLSRVLDALRVEPPTPEQVEAYAAQRVELEARRDSLFVAVDALDAALPQVHALGWADAAAALEQQQQLVPELTQQHQQLENAAAEAEAQLSEREVEWESATEALQQARAGHVAVGAHIEHASQDLEAFGGELPTEQGEQELAARRQHLESSVVSLEAEGRRLATQIALCTERRASAAARRESQVAALAAAESEAGPASAAWEELQRRARQDGLALPVSLDAKAPLSADCWPEARSRRQLLVDRLLSSDGAAELESALEAPVGDHALSYLELWLEVRGWLHKRLPAQVADVDDPLEALQRLRDDLSTLESRLRHQEHELRGASEDVARSIDAQVRRAARQVRRINQYLEGIAFGSIAAIRIQMGRVDKMEQVLGALRDGSAQSLLFQSQLPFEEALDEIFKRYGGGRGGGYRILDYREYVDLQVEVQRRSSEGRWELANPTRVSTGEAIGVGAALMMVILTEWERDANLMRGSKRFGSLRFLFLDEANRLSQDNLGVLFELCQSLQLQLLIAAPEVARADGNTTYRLVRRMDEDGREEVLVSGRRRTLPGAPAADAEESDPTSAPPAPQQTEAEPEAQASLELFS